MKFFKEAILSAGLAFTGCGEKPPAPQRQNDTPSFCQQFAHQIKAVAWGNCVYRNLYPEIPSAQRLNCPEDPEQVERDALAKCKEEFGEEDHTNINLGW